MATKQDLAGVETRLTAAMTAGFAEFSVKLAEGLDHAATERAAINTRITEGLDHAATERAAINTRITEGLDHAATERAAINKGQARQLYVIVTTTVATIVAATVSIWIALFSALGS
ncbi:MAG: hypothetical protein OXG41_01330 [Acidimicrobiaceae bacterium]|nr:hypothetical protein [Acidimicrobiaceae bacterium]